MALAFVEGQVIFSGSGIATTPAFTNTFAVGQVVVVSISYDGGSNATTSVTDNATTPNTYAIIPSASTGGAGSSYQAVYWSVITTSKATPTVTVNFNSAATNGNVVVQYFNGFLHTPTLDGIKSQINTTSTTVTSGASGATTQNIELVVGIGTYFNATTTTFTLGSGYTNLSQSNHASGSVAMESKVTSTTGAQTATFTLAVTKVNNGGVVTIYDSTPVVSTGLSTILMMGV